MDRPAKAYRPMPRGFAEYYVQHGVNGSKAHFHAHFRSIKAWINQSGGEDLLRQRAEWLRANGRAPSVSKVWHRKRLMALAHSQQAGE